MPYLSYKRQLKIKILNSLQDFLYLFHHDKIVDRTGNNFGQLSIINRTFQKCYLGDDSTENFFDNVINSENGDYSRYLFFYVNFLIAEGKIDEAKKYLIK